jgi:hypothetical protein
VNRYTDHALAFFGSRGIDPAVAAELGVVQDGDDLIFPPVGRRRNLNGAGPAKVRQPRGKRLALWCLTPLGPAVLLAEGETDALAAYTALTFAPADAAPITDRAIPGSRVPL